MPMHSLHICYVELSKCDFLDGLRVQDKMESNRSLTFFFSQAKTPLRMVIVNFSQEKAAETEVKNVLLN